MRSFASRNQLAAYPTERQKGQELEWERRYVTVLGAANKRLYQFRLQSLDRTFEQTPVGAIMKALTIPSHAHHTTIIECHSAFPVITKSMLMRLELVISKLLIQDAEELGMMLSAGGALDNCPVIPMQGGRGIGPEGTVYTYMRI